MNFGPSSGFMKNLPGMINAVGSQYGGAMSGASKLSGGMMNKRPGMPGARNKQPGVMPSSQPFGNINFGGPSTMGQPGGGMAPPTQPSTMGAPSPMGMGASGMGMGGMTSGFMDPNRAGGQLWNNYNNTSMPGMDDRYPQNPPGLNRQVFY